MPWIALTATTREHGLESYFGPRYRIRDGHPSHPEYPSFEADAVEATTARATEYEAADALVAAAGLPLDDLERCRATQYVMLERGTVVATAALEIRGSDAILRSVAVDPEYRGQGLGERVVEHAVAEARGHGLASLYLLTETADGFFERFGFVRAVRAEAPPPVQESAEYASVCGPAAVAMVLQLGRRTA